MTRKRGLFGLRRLHNGHATATTTSGGQAQEQASVNAAPALTTPKSKAVSAVLGGREPTLREIRDRAYYIYLARGGVNGDPKTDWLRAERELRDEYSRIAQSE